MEDIGSHGADCPSAKKGRACAPGALGQGVGCTCLLVPTSS